MKHHDFRTDIRDAAAGDALDAIEAGILPSLTMMIDCAAGARPGIDAESAAADLRVLARRLELLTGLLAAGPPRHSAEPFSTDA